MSVRLHSRHPHGRSSLLAVLVATLVCALLACAPSAVADVGEKIVLRCTHHESLSGFTPADYRKALGELEADTEEYSDCAQRIRQAEEAAATRALGGGGAGLGGPGGGAAAFVPVAATPAQQRAIARAEHAHPAPVALAGHVIDPGVVHADIASAFSTLPTPLLAMLAFLLACLLLVCGGALRNRVRGRADAD